MMEKVKLIREYQDKQTIGKLITKTVNLTTIELVWNENKTRKSCIPEGVYKVVNRYSKKYGNHFHLLGVPKRSLILIHIANYHFQLLGCIGVGLNHKDINKDGLLDNVSSASAMSLLLQLYPKGFELQVCS